VLSVVRCCGLFTCVCVFARDGVGKSGCGVGWVPCAVVSGVTYVLWSARLGCVCCVAVVASREGSIG